MVLCDCVDNGGEDGGPDIASEAFALHGNVSLLGGVGDIDTGQIAHATGDNPNASVTSVDVPSLASAGLAESAVTPDSATTTITGLSIGIGGVLGISADTVSATVEDGTPSVTLAGLEVTVAGLEVDVPLDPGPNTTIELAIPNPVPGLPDVTIATLTLNEQAAEGDEITVTAMRLTLLGGVAGALGEGDVRVAEATYRPAALGVLAVNCTEFLRTYNNDGTTTDTELDGVTPYTPRGEVGACRGADGEPGAAMTVLCDCVDGGEDDPECVEFLRAYLPDGGTADYEMDGTTPYEPVGDVGACPGVEGPEGPRAVVLCDRIDGGEDSSESVQFIRTYHDDGSTTDTEMDGTTPYEPVGEVGACVDECPNTVQLIRLCDLNPDVEPDEDGRRCGVAFLRRIVTDCHGETVSTSDVELDGVTPYSPVEVVDCGCCGGTPALVELEWPRTSVAPDPDFPDSVRHYVYTIENPRTGETAQIKLETNRDPGGGCQPVPDDPDNPVFNNPTVYRLTLDDTARQMSTFRLDLIDFDTFEGITQLTPAPSRVEGDVTWDGGSTITANTNNITAYVYWDEPPAEISYRYGNTGGGNACTMVSFQGLTFEPEGCCGDCGGGGGEGPPDECRTSSTVVLCDNTASDTGALSASPADDPERFNAWDGYGVTPLWCLDGHDAGTLFSGGSVTIGPGEVCPNPAGRHGVVAGVLAAPGYDCDGDVTVTASVRVTNDGPDAGVQDDGVAALWNTATETMLTSQPIQPGAPAGYQATVTVSAAVSIADLEAGNIAFSIDAETQQNTSSKAWTFDQFTASFADGTCVDPRPFMRTVTRDCDSGEVTAVTDTELDGTTPYVPTGEVGTCPGGADPEPLITACGLAGEGTPAAPLAVNTGGAEWGWACDTSSGLPVYCGSDGALRVDPEKYHLIESVFEQNPQDILPGAEGSTTPIFDRTLTLVNPSSCREMQVDLKVQLDALQMVMSPGNDWSIRWGFAYTVDGSDPDEPELIGSWHRYRHSPLASGSVVNRYPIMDASFAPYVPITLPPGGVLNARVRVGVAWTQVNPDTPEENYPTLLQIETFALYAEGWSL